MRIDIISIFPEIFTPLNSSILKRAQEKKLLILKLWNLRDFSRDRHRKVDDAPYGGGKGMVLKCEPIFRCVEAVKKENPGAKVILTSPQGTLFDQNTGRSFSELKGIIIICGHYEGIDERVKKLVDYEISVGDYVLTGGELPAMVITDAVTRLLPGVLPREAAKYDSFFEYLFDWPCYTRPAKFKSMKVPEVLISGDHKKIEEWRKKQAVRKTKGKRPDLYRRYRDCQTKD